MPSLTAVAVALALTASAAPAAPRTFRVDYFHTGTATSETFSLDRLVVEPLPFPGRPERAVDDLGLGKYLFEVRDQQSGALLYSRGFASVYGEWETTDEARTLARTFSESLRFPAPSAPVKVVLKKRAADQSFREAWTLLVDPKDQAVDDRAAAVARPGHRPPGERPAGEQVRPAAGRRRLHRGRARPLRGRRAPPPRGALRHRAVAVAARRRQRLGALPALGAVRRLPPLHRRPPPQPGGGHLRRLRLRAVRAQLREPLVARRRLLRAVRRHGHHRQRRDLRRRRHLQPLRHRGGPLEVGRVHLRPRAGPLGGGAGRRVLHQRHRLPARRASASSRGSRTSPTTRRRPSGPTW